MVRNVVLQIRQAQQQFQDLLIGRFVAHRRKRPRCVTRVAEQPVYNFLIRRFGCDATGAHVVGALDYFFNEVIQAHSVRGQNGQNLSAASGHMAWASHRGIPSAPGEGTEQLPAL
jgi:hypothetical protein